MPPTCPSSLKQLHPPGAGACAGDRWASHQLAPLLPSVSTLDQGGGSRWRKRLREVFLPSRTHWGLRALWLKQAGDLHGLGRASVERTQNCIQGRSLQPPFPEPERHPLRHLLSEWNSKCFLQKCQALCVNAGNQSPMRVLDPGSKDPAEPGSAHSCPPSSHDLIKETAYRKNQHGLKSIELETQSPTPRDLVLLRCDTCVIC